MKLVNLDCSEIISLLLMNIIFMILFPIYIGFISFVVRPNEFVVMQYLGKIRSVYSTPGIHLSFFLIGRDLHTVSKSI